MDLMNFVRIFLSGMTLLRQLTFLLGSLTVMFTVLPLWVCLYHLMLAFVLQWLFPPQEILIMSQFPLTFHQTQNKMPCFIIYLLPILLLIGKSPKSIYQVWCLLTSDFPTFFLTSFLFKYNERLLIQQKLILKCH